MGNEKIKKHRFVFRHISDIEQNLIEKFTCGTEELDNKFRQMRSFDEGTTIVFIDETENEIVGYCTYCASGLRMFYGNDAITHPAAEIKYFAISVDYQHCEYDEDFNVSDVMLCHLIKHLIDISEQYISFDYILLYSVPNAVSFYTRNFFEPFTEYMSKDSYCFLKAAYRCILQFNSRVFLLRNTIPTITPSRKKMPAKPSPFTPSLPPPTPTKSTVRCGSAPNTHNPEMKELTVRLTPIVNSLFFTVN